MRQEWGTINSPDEEEQLPKPESVQGEKDFWDAFRGFVCEETALH